MSNILDVNKVCSALEISTSKQSIVALVSDLIDASIEIAQNYCGRKFIKDTYKERFIGVGLDYVITQNYPILEVLQAPSAVEFFDKNEIVFASKITKGQVFYVEYEAGFDVLPKDLELAIIELVGWRYKSLGHLDVTTNRDKEGSTVSYVRSDLPENVKSIFEKYRKKY